MKALAMFCPAASIPARERASISISNDRGENSLLIRDASLEASGPGNCDDDQKFLPIRVSSDSSRSFCHSARSAYWIGSDSADLPASAAA